MKIKYHLLTLFLFITFLDVNATTHSTTNNAKDSVLLIIKTADNVDYIEYAYEKGDNIIYQDDKKKYKAEILGFRGNKMIVKNKINGKIRKVDIHKLKSIQKFSPNRRSVNIGLAVMSLVSLISMLIFSVENASPSSCSWICFSALDIFIALFLIIFLPLALLTFIIYKLVKRGKKQPRFNLGTNFRAEMKK